MREEFINVVAETTLLEFIIDVTKIIPVTHMFSYLRKPSGQHEAFYPTKTQLMVKMKFTPLHLEAAKDEAEKIAFEANQQLAEFEGFLDRCEHTIEAIKLYITNLELIGLALSLEVVCSTGAKGIPKVAIQDSTIIPPGEQVLIGGTIINDSTGDPSILDVGGYVMDSTEKSAHVATTFLESFMMILNPLVL
ncbi:hypothetical protein V6N13_114349 [Hibiscus sabdariffa]